MSFREVCPRCRCAKATCYCGRLKPLQTAPKFVILMHPKEARKKIGTGRMAHLSLRNSILLEGVDFSAHPVVNALINGADNRCFVLFPGPGAVSLEADAPELRRLGGQVVIFVLDGTWSCARKMLKLSRNLSGLKRLSFARSSASEYRIRRQPEAHCLSTIEAIAHMLDHLHGNDHFLLNPFMQMVENQLAYSQPR